MLLVALSGLKDKCLVINSLSPRDHGWPLFPSHQPPYLIQHHFLARVGLEPVTHLVLVPFTAELLSWSFTGFKYEPHPIPSPLMGTAQSGTHHLTIIAWKSEIQQGTERDMSSWEWDPGANRTGGGAHRPNVPMVAGKALLLMELDDFTDDSYHTIKEKIVSVLPKLL